MLYAELNIEGERIIYPFPVPENKKPYKVERILEGSEIEINGIAPLHLFNGTLIYVREFPKSHPVRIPEPTYNLRRPIVPEKNAEPGPEDQIQRWQVEVKKGDAQGISAANAAMQSIIDEVRGYKEERERLEKLTAEVARIMDKKRAERAHLTKTVFQPGGIHLHKTGPTFADVGYPCSPCPEKEDSALIDQSVIIEMQTPTPEQVTEALEKKIKKPFPFSGGFEFVPPVKREYEPEQTTCKHPRTGQVKGFKEMWCYSCFKFVQPQNK